VRHDAPPSAVTIEQLLAEARAGLPRLTPAEAHAAMERGAVLVDMRSDEQRSEHGVVPGAICVARNVLEWRLDPACPHRDERFARPDAQVMLLCQQGYQSSLVAATARRLGVRAATDVIGGFEAWAAAGLPVAPRV
jgi:rhodanese-related sulfurtransferase